MNNGLSIIKSDFRSLPNNPDTSTNTTTEKEYMIKQQQQQQQPVGISSPSSTITTTTASIPPSSAPGLAPQKDKQQEQQHTPSSSNSPSLLPSPSSRNSVSSNSNTGTGSGSEPLHPNAKTTTTTQSNGATTTKQNMSTATCKNCKTQNTPLWRRDESGQVLCNACGLFLKLHGRPRPISLKSDVIKSRNRVKHNNSKSSPNTPELKAKEAGNGKVTKFLPKQYKPKKKNSKSKENNTANNSGSGSGGNATVADLTAAASGLDKNKSPSLLPLLPRNAANNQSASGADGSRGNTVIAPNVAPGTPYTFAATTNWMNKSQGNNIQPLHYPNSTPTQFAPNLTRVTSPLLLSTTLPVQNNVPNGKFNPSQSSERLSSSGGNGGHLAWIRFLESS
ncbi:unnamed protein product [Ambrosiozyma monospora]|uniref:Unnamed protein product n=1 Tax=Ambrosiozyma monospora TaxID=43982 RepID=A0ACB5T1K0_AMBMO|nr:unnamed protein product [Ambrosiozyma monospora]